MLTALLISVALSAGHMPMAINECAPALSVVDACSVDTVNDGTAITVGGTQTSGSQNGNNSSGSSGSDRSGGDGSQNPSPSPGVREGLLCGNGEYELFDIGYCNPQEEEDSLPVITLEDLARFLPASAPLTVEPDGVGVAGLPTNFVASTAAHTAHGMLFDHPLSVRFTPVGHTFFYGDGISVRTDTAGRSWSALGQPQFTPTDTSHTYRDRGTYTTRVDAHYSAELNIGHGWRPLDGELTSRGADQSVRIYEARTALVAQTCDVNRNAAGC